MKNLFLRREPRRVIELFLHQIMGVLGVVMLMSLLNSCASPPFVPNIESKSELKGNKKVLAGRFVCFDNNAPVHCTRSGFLIYFNRERETQANLFNPDDAGYVYIAATEGVYYFGRFVKGGKDQSFIFNPDPFPVVLVRTEDSVVNFGTLEVRFYRDGSSRINHIANYDATRSEIASRLGKIGGSINDGTVQFWERARK